MNRKLKYNYSTTNSSYMITNLIIKKNYFINLMFKFDSFEFRKYFINYTFAVAFSKAI